MSKLLRREMLAITTVGSAGVALSTGYTLSADARLPAGTQPRVRVGTLAAISRGPLEFSYPSSSYPAQAIRLPDGRVVAYSLFCTHMGCPVEYTAASQASTCPCHQSIFSAVREGAVLQGSGPRPLPEIRVEIDTKTGTIYAVGISAPPYGASEG